MEGEQLLSRCGLLLLCCPSSSPLQYSTPPNIALPTTFRPIVILTPCHPPPPLLQVRPSLCSCLCLSPCLLDVGEIWLYLKEAGSPNHMPNRVVSYAFTGLSVPPLGPWLERSSARPFSSKKSWGWRLCKASDVLCDFSRLFGPKKDLVQIQVTVRVWGECSVERMLTTPSEQVLQLRFPSAVLDAAFLVYDFEALGLGWHMLFSSVPSKTDVALIVDKCGWLGAPEDTKDFAVTVVLVHPSNHASSVKCPDAPVKVSHASGCHKQVACFPWGNQPRRSFTWDDQDVVLRCVIEAL